METYASGVRAIVEFLQGCEYNYAPKTSENLRGGETDEYELTAKGCTKQPVSTVHGTLVHPSELECSDKPRSL